MDGPEGTGREGEPTMAAALAYVFSGRDSAELWGCKDPGSGPWIELLYRQELATLQEWFGKNFNKFFFVVGREFFQ